mgnify:CR=1 FL=1
MILNEREMQMARELARELVRIEKEKQSKEFEEAFKNVKNKVIEAWEIIKSVFEEAFKTLHDLDNRERERSEWHVPLKIEIPPMPDIQIPRLTNARSNI